MNLKVKASHFSKRRDRHDNQSNSRLCQDACTFYRFSPKQVPKYGIREQSVAQLRTLPIYTSRSYDQGFHNAFNEVSFLQKNTEIDINIHFWTLRASTHERPPCVLRHMGNAYAVSHIFTHTLPSTIETAPKRLTLNGQRCIRHNNVFTSRTLALRDIQG